MRQILFRGKCFGNKEWIKDGKWVEGLPMYTANKSEKGKIDRILTLRDGYYSILLVCPETVCQYTGMTDKNGRKIFEGDIVKYHFGEDVAPVRFGSYQSCFDSQQAEHCGFYVDWKAEKNLRKDLGYWVHMVDAEIVGNIHDNLELIGADKQG